MNEIERQDNAWVLYALDESYRLVLSVLCGGAAVYELNVELSVEEREEYMVAGRVSLEILAGKVRSCPGKYQARHVRLSR